MIIQTIIALSSGIAIWMIGQKKSWYKYGFIIGFLGQPFWLYATWKADQWGMFALSIWYTFAYLHGYWNNRDMNRIKDNAN